MSESKISVIIPTKNRGRELKRAIDSVLNQSYKNFEILVVDDHSEEDIKGIVEGYGNVKIEYFKSNKVISNANVCRNIGIDNAGGNYIAMLDSDDEWLPNHLGDTLNYLKSENCQGVFSSIIVDNGETHETAYSLPLNENQLMVNYILQGGNVQTSTHFYVAKAAKEVRWDESLHRHQDFDFAVRFHQKYKFKAKITPSVIVHWQKGVKRYESFESQMKFIAQNKGDILPRYYSSYHRNTYNRIKNRTDVDEKYIKHFKRESLRYMNVLSLNDFMSTFGENSSFFKRFLLRVKFSIFTCLS